MSLRKIFLPSASKKQIPHSWSAVIKVRLLQTRDAARFATDMSVSAADWLSWMTPKLSADDQEKIKMFAKDADKGRDRTEASAKALLARAESLNLDLSKGVCHSASTL